MGCVAYTIGDREKWHIRSRDRLSKRVLLVARIPLPDGKRLRNECGDKVSLPIQELRVYLDANRRRGAGCFVPTVCDLDIRRVGVRSRALDAQEIGFGGGRCGVVRSEEHTSELQSLMRISYAVFCLKKKIRKLSYQMRHNTLK